jgi:hypothetical protein
MVNSNHFILWSIIHATQTAISRFLGCITLSGGVAQLLLCYRWSTVRISVLEAWFHLLVLLLYPSPDHSISCEAYDGSAHQQGHNDPTSQAPTTSCLWCSGLVE